MNGADWIIAGVIAVSSLISIKRGFVKEALSLAVLTAAFFIAVSFHERLAVLLQDTIEGASIRYPLSFAALFAATLIVGSMIKHLMGELVKITGLSSTDRLFGMAFGLVRGGIIVMAILILMPMLVPVQQDQWWQQSLLIPHFLLVEQWCKDTFTALISWLGSFF